MEFNRSYVGKVVLELMSPSQEFALSRYGIWVSGVVRMLIMRDDILTKRIRRAARFDPKHGASFSSIVVSLYPSELLSLLPKGPADYYI